MAGTLAEMLVGSTLQSAQADPQLEQIAGIASNIANVKAQRQQIELKKQELQMQKTNAIVDTLKIAAGSKDQKLKNFLLKNVMPSKVKALGMEEFFTPQTMEMLQTSEDVQRKVLGLQLDLDQKVRSGQISGAQAYQIAQGILADPEQLAMLDTDQLFEAQKFAASEEGKAVRAEYVARAASGRQEATRKATGETEVSKKTAQEFVDYTAAGGSANLSSNLDKLREAANKLKSGKIKTGGLGGVIKSADGAADILDPEMSAVRDDVRNAIQTSLRQVLGAQFTEKEGAALFNRAFNPRLPAKENARRLEIEIKKLEQMKNDKEKQFRSQGFDAGSSAAPRVMNDWSGILNNQKEKVMRLDDKELQKYIEGFAKKHGITVEEVKQALGIQ